MDGTSDEVRKQIAAAEAHLRAGHQAIQAALALAQNAELSEKDLGPVLLEASQLVGWSGQAHDGELVQLLGQAQRFKANPGGMVPWISTHLDVTTGAARGIDQSAREIGRLPELSEALSSGQIGAATIRALTRTARAVKGSKQDLAAALHQTLDLSANGNIGEANRHVRILEETLDPGRAERQLEQQRSRSFLRFIRCENGMTRLEALLDLESATTVRTAIDATVAHDLRTLQYDGKPAASREEEQERTEQLQARALARFAQVYIDADAKQRGAAFTPATVYTRPADPRELAGLAETAYGELISSSVIAPMQHPAARLLLHLNGQPVAVNGRLLDLDPTARLATPDQRIALAWRDKHCTYPGCDRPPTWSLHAHHKIPFGKNGPTIVSNLVLLCSEHHVLTHHPRC